MKIETLTPEQKEKLQEYFQTYLSHGLSTESANKVLAEKTISETYKKLGKEVPEFIWKPSPKSCIDYINENKLRNQLGYQLRHQLSYQLRDQLWNQLSYQLYNQLENQLKNQLYDQLYDQLGYQLSYQLRDQLWNQLSYQLYNQYIATDLWGQFDLYWVAYYKFCFEQLPVKGNKEDLESLNLWDQIGKSCSLWYPYENICVISDRPEEIHLNNFGELHNESGMAIRFRDNWGIYSINGISVPGWIITSPEKITPENIDHEGNIEIRRIMIDIFGHGRYLQETGAEVIDMDTCPIGTNIPGSITRMLIKDKNDFVYLCSHDGSTDRIYYMSVDPGSRTCRQAHESICGLSEQNMIAQS